MFTLRNFLWLSIGAIIFLSLLTFNPPEPASAAPAFQVPEPQPTPDRLAIPVLSDNPTQVEIGSSVYYYNCMPCHGDQCQGLTDEFREIWVEDHQNCWASGCHGGRERDEGFPLPRQIPDVLGLESFQETEDLFQYLQITHPPQRPGALSEAEYWSATAFLLYKSGRMAYNESVHANQAADGNEPNPAKTDLQGLFIFLISIPILSWLLIRQTRQVGR